MDSQQLQKKITETLDNNKFCSFATIEGNKPKVRYMALFHDNLTIYLATNKNTHKVEELQSNPHVHIAVGFDGKPSSQILQIEATAKVTSDTQLREKLWNPEFKQWFEGPQDPNYVVLEIAPDRIEYSEGDQAQHKGVWEREKVQSSK